MTEPDSINQWLNTIMSPLRAAQRRELMRILAKLLQQRQAKRIQQQNNPDGSPFETRKPRKGVRQRVMFRRIRQRKNLQQRSTANQAQVGFSGRTARIAKIHQTGEVAAVEPNGPLVRYAQRQLLGATESDLNALEAQALAHLNTQ